MAIYRAIVVLILSCVGVTASVRLAAGAQRIGEINRAEYRPAHGAVQGAVLTALDATFDITPDGSGAADLAPRIALTSDSAIIGTASFYEGAQETSSGEQYDPAEFTAAAQLEIRDRFGGIRFGKNYQPCYAIGEFGGKKIIVKFNDVGPLMPGRKFDLSRAAMAYFDESLQTGLLPEFRITPLPLGQTYTTGPVSDEQLAAMGIAYGDDAIVTTRLAAPVEPEVSDVDEAQAPETVATVPEPMMQRDDALQERRAFADPEDRAPDSSSVPYVASEISLFTRDIGSEGTLVTFGDLIEAGRRLVALVGSSVGSSGRREHVAVRERRDGKVEDSASGDLNRRPLLLL